MKVVRRQQELPKTSAQLANEAELAKQKNKQKSKYPQRWTREQIEEYEEDVYGYTEDKGPTQAQKDAEAEAFLYFHLRKNDK